MSEVAIGAEASQWDGLQIDLLQKHRHGHVTAKHLRWFLGLTAGDRDALAVREALPPKGISSCKQEKKFETLVDFGVITVPDDYVHGTFLSRYSPMNSGHFYAFDENILDDYFQSPSFILKPGDKLWVRGFRQTCSARTTSQERMTFLEGQDGNVYVGAQGALLVSEIARKIAFQKIEQIFAGKKIGDIPGQFVRGYGYMSFDKKERLYKSCAIPCLYMGLGEGNHGQGDYRYSFGLENFGDDFGEKEAFLAFCLVP